jgi:hypothetical protein
MVRLSCRLGGEDPKNHGSTKEVGAIWLALIVDDGVDESEVRIWPHRHYRARTGRAWFEESRIDLLWSKKTGFTHYISETDPKHLSLIPTSYRHSIPARLALRMRGRGASYAS